MAVPLEDAARMRREGMSHKEIAAHFGITVNTSKAWVWRAKKAGIDTAAKTNCPCCGAPPSKWKKAP